MHILFLSELFYPHGSGAELATYLYAKLLTEKGIGVTVVTNKFGDEPYVSKYGNLRVLRLPMFSSAESFKYSILKRVDMLFSTPMKDLFNWADLVYIPRFWFSAIPVAKIYGKPVLLHLHDYIPICSLSTNYDISAQRTCNRKILRCSPKCIYTFEKAEGGNLRRAFSSVVLNSAFGVPIAELVRMSDAIICVSQFQKRAITKREPSLSERSYVIYNPFLESARSELKNHDFGFFGGTSYLKGFSTLYNAVKQLKLAGHETLRIHCSKFSVRSSDVSSILSRSGFVLHGKLGLDDYLRMYQEIEAVIVPSVWQEPWPYVVVEALVNGRFVIGSRVGGIPEQVEKCPGSLLVEAGNSAQLSQAIEFVRGLNREQVIDLGSKNREVFLGRFSNKSSVNSFISIGENLIKAHS